MRRPTLPGVILAAMVLAASCGGGNDDSSTGAVLPTPTAELIPLVVPTRPPGQVWVDALWFVDGARGWLGGSYCGDLSEEQDCTGVIFRTDDGGITWRLQYQGVVPTQIEFTDAQQGMALGHDAAASCVALLWQVSCDAAAHVLVTRDGGAHWEETYRVGWVEPYAVDRMSAELALSADDAWIAADECTSPLERIVCETRLLRSGDGGQTWSQMPLSIGRLDGISRPTETDAWVWGWDATGPRLVATHDAGATWSMLQTPGSGTHVFHFRDAAQGWAVVGSHTAAGTQMKEVFATQDGGMTWQRRARAPSSPPAAQTTGTITSTGYVGPMEFTSSTEGWMALSRLGLLHTSDGGATWDETYTNADGLRNVQFAGAQYGWAYRSTVLIMTSDGGASWRELPLPTLELPP